MIRASRVEEDRAALDRGSNGKVAATIDIAHAMQLELAHEVTTDGKATVQLRGELDIATADQAFAYLCDVVDSQQGRSPMNLADLTFCDAAGLGVLARVAGHARRSGHSSSSPPPARHCCGSCTSPEWTRHFPRSALRHSR